MDRIHFSDFVLHRQTHRVTCASKDILTGSRSFDLLDMLISLRDRVVPRNEITEAIWPDTVVGDNNLNVQVANLRRLLRSDANHHHTGA